MASNDDSNVFRPNLFLNKTAVVTGGGSGIGFAIAKQLAILGCTVIIGSRCKKNELKLQTAANEINSMIASSEHNLTNKCIGIKLDVRSSESITNFFNILSHKHNIKMVNYLINNAGGQFISPLHQISEKGWKTVMDTNLNGIFLISNYVFNKYWKRIKKNEEKIDKVIINITANSFNGMPMMAHSGAARAGVENLTMAQCQNWSKYGVRVNSVAPGFIKSSGLDSYPKAARDMMGIHVKDNYLYRYGNMEEVSQMVLFLLSNGASFITGTCIKVDGGESIYNPLLPPAKSLYRSSKL